ncbi:alpha-beta hydrolase superfamily lysophospholipase [Neolewinella xylanilytica]|uniref:Alpha-beta hydrolase superfamily lysophospholipase n=1 Tax=Neolewinella xylanilytica TaxID=1514080 RepID=A0A2S6IB38_9BACT|nr:alpha/beta hydrolase [Neolewinella xylanilytica]PPK88727.1 alpha-beta hydrolase superfamily lysophospholipase [Neolewinella xylanilytica]
MKYPSKWWIVPGALLAVAAAAYFMGPALDPPEYSTTLPKLPELGELEDFIQRRERDAPTRQNNEARIVWADATHAVTEYAFVYLHGFGASYRDGFPVNVNVPAIFGANVYLSRWSGHGLLPDDALELFTAERAWEDAKTALLIGQRIGKKVILFSTSTGGTLSLQLAATYPERVHAMINIGPNVEDDQPGASLLMSPWGHELAHLAALGQNRKITHDEPEAAQYFDTIYPAEALVQLQILVQTTMRDTTFESIECPVLTLYYKENFFQKDQHVEVTRLPEIQDLFVTPEDKKQLITLPTPKSHFMASDIKSEDWMATQRVIVEFCRSVLGMEPLHSVDYVANAPCL